jgi:hypothetical protein
MIYTATLAALVAAFAYILLQVQGVHTLSSMATSLWKTVTRRLKGGQSGEEWRRKKAMWCGRREGGRRGMIPCQ